jgi:hypothetical protein
MQSARENLRPIGVAYQRIRLSCLDACSIDDEIIAYVRGIPIGSARVNARLKPGDHIDIPVDYLPWVELPTEIHCSARNESVAITRPLPLINADEALMLVGPGEVTVSNLSIDQGMLRGTATNRVNGLIRPNMFARVNGLVVRAVSIEQPRLLDDGGCSFQFAVPLYPGDISDNGLSVDILLVGTEAPITSVTFARMQVADQEKRLIELESRIRELQQLSGLQIGALKSEFEANMARMQRRMEVFIEYASAFMFDRKAAVVVEASSPADPALASKVTAFRELVSSAASGGATEAAQALTQAVSTLPIRSSLYAFGWYDVESTPEGEYRWMAQRSVVFNPEPQRPVAEVMMMVQAVYGADAPAIQCSFDSEDAEVAVERQPGPARFKIRIKHRSAKSTHVQALRLESLNSGSPARDEGSHDDRVLSLSVLGIGFIYADQQAARPVRLAAVG